MTEAPQTHAPEPPSALPHDVQHAEKLTYEWIQLGIRMFVLTLSISMWTVLGFLVWVPLLLRAVLLMAAAVLYSTLLRRDTRRAEARLAHAMEFYPRGYERIFQAVAGKRGADLDDDDRPSLRERVSGATLLIVELLMSVAFWYIIGAALSAWDWPDFKAISDTLQSTFNSIVNLF
jgi:hypothetical protein